MDQIAGIQVTARKVRRRFLQAARYPDHGIDVGVARQPVQGRGGLFDLWNFRHGFFVFRNPPFGFFSGVRLGSGLPAFR